MNLNCRERTQLSGKTCMEMPSDCHGLTVDCMRFVHRRGPVLYASLPFGPCGPSGSETRRVCRTGREGVKLRIVSFLWDYLVALESPFWKYSQSFDKAACQLKVVRGLLGRPHLLLGKNPGPAISFSEGGGKIWAALCADDSDIGIDVAETHEFLGKYPFHRVFHPQELQHALRLTGGDLGNASALLWSVKEAVVKALGCAFHLVGPLELIVYPSTERAAEGASERAAVGNGWYIFPVRLSGKALVRFPTGAVRSIWVHSHPKGKMWFSVALLNLQHQCYDE